MQYDPIGPGDEAPKTVNLIIEIQRGGRNKYEFDKKTGYLTLDRVNGNTTVYPADYGYVPGTLCEDGDPLDGLLIIDESVAHNAVLRVRAVGVLYMIDDGESDEKRICVPADDISKDHLKDLDDFSDKGENLKKVVEHFYKHYKLWKNNWQGSPVEFKGWGNAEEAKKVVQESIERAKNSQHLA